MSTSASSSHHQGIFLRNAEPEDCVLLWRWANDPSTRAMSFTTEFISWEQHCEWYKKKLADTTCAIFIALNEHSIPIGQVRFDCNERDATLSVSIDPDQRGKGFGGILIQQAADKLFQKHSIELIHAYVKPGNDASAKLFLRSGYEEQIPKEIDGHPAMHFLFKKAML